jgi:hypothetical protein
MWKKIIIIITAFFLMSSLCFAVDNYFEISLHYYYGNLSENYVIVKPLISQTFFPEVGEYTAEIVDNDNNILYTTNFDIITITGIDMFNLTETFGRFDFDFEINLPYFPNAKTINIYDNESEKLLAVDLGLYSAREYFIEEEKEVVAEEVPGEIEKPPVEETLKEENKTGRYLIISAVILVALILIVITLRKVIKRKEPEIQST